MHNDETPRKHTRTPRARRPALGTFSETPIIERPRSVSKKLWITTHKAKYVERYLLDFRKISVQIWRWGPIRRRPTGSANSPILNGLAWERDQLVLWWGSDTMCRVRRVVFVSRGCPGKPQVKEEESSSSKATLLFEFFRPVWFRVRFANVGSRIVFVLFIRMVYNILGFRLRPCIL